MVMIRPAARADTRQMAELLNEIIQAGGTTAMIQPVSSQDLDEWMVADENQNAWHVAHDAQGLILGFQWIGPSAGLPKEAIDIASFVRIGYVGWGIGSRLFDATRKAAKDKGYEWINAAIRADNQSGLTYYQSQGFRDWKHVNNVALADGTIVSKIYKRYDLRD